LEPKRPETWDQFSMDLRRFVGVEWLASIHSITNDEFEFTFTGAASGRGSWMLKKDMFGVSASPNLDRIREMYEMDPLVQSLCDYIEMK
jgi:hypothetical protein